MAQIAHKWLVLGWKFLDMALTLPLSPSPLLAAAAAISESLSGLVPLPRHATTATFDPYQLSDWEGDTIDSVGVLLSCFSPVTPHCFHVSLSYVSQLIYTRS